ncbi:MAG TPA: EAL domain-containing response regulator [Polyangiaceae bacterium]|nr:EAL domain-containing response regulator [Polyangiaceae bacterium]
MSNVPVTAESGGVSGAGVVLLVDDELMVLRAMARTLGGHDYTVETCTSADLAIGRIRGGGIDVVVSDISMPGMSGVELLRSIREYEPDLPVLLITGLPALESATEAIEYGALKYLVKPVDPAALTRAVDKAMQLYRLARMKREALALLGMAGGASDRAGLEAGFERALSSLWMAWQPIVRAADGSIFGYEALLRSHEASLPTPIEVLDAAERLGQLPRLGRVVRDSTATPFTSAATGMAFFVNLHPEDLLDPELGSPESALTLIAHSVVLEITERASLENVHNVRARVRALRDVGFRIAIDDLGAGYAGLTSFALLEPDIVKLDMALVRGVDHKSVQQKLVASMTTLCKDMGLLVVAEGVETPQERDTLIALGCDLLQGFLFARPGPAFPTVRW